MKAVLGVPPSCPVCGGQLVPAFGQTVDDAGVRRPVVDETVIRCRECFRMFPAASIYGPDESANVAGK